MYVERIVSSESCYCCNEYGETLFRLEDAYANRSIKGTNAFVKGGCQIAVDMF